MGSCFLVFGCHQSFPLAAHTPAQLEQLPFLPERIAKLLSLDGDQSGGYYRCTISLPNLCKMFLAKGGETKLVMTLIMYIARYVLVKSWELEIQAEIRATANNIKDF